VAGLAVCVAAGLVGTIAPELVDRVAPLAVARIIGACDDMNLTNAWWAARVCACCRALALSVPGAKLVSIVADNATTIMTAMDVPIGFFI
jgi:hypothetical protein